MFMDTCHFYRLSLRKFFQPSLEENFVQYIYIYIYIYIYEHFKVRLNLIILSLKEDNLSNIDVIQRVHKCNTLSFDQNLDLSVD
jgi:hypothetical protein